MKLYGHFVGGVDFTGTVVIDNGIIIDIIYGLVEDAIIIDSKYLIFPGMIDIHVHSREDETGLQNYKETYQTCKDAAISGGVVAFCAMPNTPNPVVTMEQLRWHQVKSQEYIKDLTVINYIGVGPETKPLDIKTPYKVYTGPSIGSLFFKSKEELREVLQYYRGQYVSFHVEDYETLCMHMHELTHDKRRPVLCVTIALKYVLEMIEEYNIRAKLCHWSCKEGLELICEYRKRGLDITIEVSPLHLYFDTDTITTQMWPFVQANPSIQTSDDRFALIKALKDGTIDYLATDHAPHILNEKIGTECISGTPQLDTYGLIVCWLIKQWGFNYDDIARITARNPGKFLKEFTDEKIGKTKIGYVGSFTILDLNTEVTVNKEMLKTKVEWSPFEGCVMPGKVVGVVLRGNYISSNLKQV